MMTRYFSRMIPLVAVIVMSGCQELKIDSQPAGEPRMDTDLLTEYTVNAENPRDIRFNISSTVPWSIKRSQDANWCTVTPLTSSLGALTSEVCVKAEANELYAERTLELELTAEGIDKIYRTRIVQKARSRFLVTPVENEFGIDGGTQSFTILSNAAWEAHADQPWVTLDKQSGEPSDLVQTVNVSVGASTGTQRKATIHVIPSDGSQEASFEIVQKGIKLEWKGLGSQIRDVPATGETFDVEVDSNIPWTVTCEDPVVKAVKKNEALVSIAIGTNNLFKAKTAKVVLAPANPEHSSVPSQELTLKQKVSHVLVNGTPTINADGSARMDNSAGRARFSTAKGQKYGTYIWRFKEIDIKEDAYIDINMWPVNDKPCNAFLHFYIGGNDGGGELGAGGKNKSELRSAGTILDVSQNKNVGVWKPSSYFASTQEEMANLKELKISILPTEGANMEIVISLDGVEKMHDTSRPDYWKYNPDHLLCIYFGLPKDATGEVSSVVFESFEIQGL